MKHPAEVFLKYLLLREEDPPDANILKNLQDWDILPPTITDLNFIRQQVSERPNGFDPFDRIHRPSMAFLRQHGVYELFHPTQGVNEAWDILADPTMRLNVERLLLARLDRKQTAQKLNAKHGWKLTNAGITAYYNIFWCVKNLTWDEWGRFLHGRSAFYDQHLALLQAPPELAFYHLRLAQSVESKQMIQRTQEIAYFNLEELSLRPGTGPDKLKGIGILGKVIIECHEALSTSDMALKDVLKDFERFRMEHPQIPPKDIKQLAPGGNFSGSGVDEEADVIEETPL